MLTATLLNYVFSLGGLICWVIVVVAMFRSGAPVWSRILAIVLPPWAFIWGWSTTPVFASPPHRMPTGLGRVMIVWTACMVGAFISGFVAAPYLIEG